MSLYIDKKFVALVAPKLDRFATKSEFLWNFRCPICGDSQKNKLKARGYLYRRKSDISFTCHNCHAGMSFGNFLKRLDPSLYTEYNLERWKNENSGNAPKPEFAELRVKPTFTTNKKITIPSIDSLSPKHEAREYLNKRKIPPKLFSELYYAENFKDFVLDMIPDYEKKLFEEKRIVIPFYDSAGILLGFQGRDFSVASKVKYITIKMAEECHKVYGLNKIDLSKKVYVFEGPFDSMFINNAIATMDATLYNVTFVLGNDVDYVFCYDNQPRNPDVCRVMSRTIDLGKKIFIWPKYIEGKDVNDVIMTGTTPSELQVIIDSNTFDGMRAKLEFEQWKK